jgi:hypothetical protein
LQWTNTVSFIKLSLFERLMNPNFHIVVDQRREIVGFLGTLGQ